MYKNSHLMDLDSIFLSCKVSYSWIVPIGKIVFTIRILLLSVWFIVSALQFYHIFASFSSQNVYTSFSSTFYILAFICKRTATGGKIIWIYSTFFCQTALELWNKVWNRCKWTVEILGLKGFILGSVQQSHLFLAQCLTLCLKLSTQRSFC